jgi:hypothetical protein
LDQPNPFRHAQAPDRIHVDFDHASNLARGSSALKYKSLPRDSSTPNLIHEAGGSSTGEPSPPRPTLSLVPPPPTDNFRGRFSKKPAA